MRKSCGKAADEAVSALDSDSGVERFHQSCRWRRNSSGIQHFRFYQSEVPKNVGRVTRPIMNGFGTEEEQVFIPLLAVVPDPGQKLFAGRFVDPEVREHEPRP